MAGPKQNDYFRLPGIVWLFLVPAGITLVSVAYLAPTSVPYDLLGPVGRLTKYLVVKRPQIMTGIFYMQWILHAGEAMYASTLCSAKNLTTGATIKWLLSIFIYGIFSMKHLIAYDPEEDQKHKVE